MGEFCASLIGSKTFHFLLRDSAAQTFK